MATKTVTGLAVKSIAFSHGGYIPPRYSCEGENINPPLEISDLPKETASLAIIMEDPDAQKSTFTHWVVWNIEPHEPIAENSVPGISGNNSSGKTGYTGPCPPSGSHRYFFRIYALNTHLNLEPGSGKNALQTAMQGHMLASGELMGHYKKK